uniref:Ubiquitin-like protease family profile domain-containing protein n=1 Tax=Brassica oleracea var. oleracea TaxID=109376 RepID=A0A0D3DLJ6_BRAOL
MTPKNRGPVIAYEPPEQSGEPSVLVLDKEEPTDSDLQKGETRRQRKMNAAMAHVRGKSERPRKLAASQKTPFKGNNTAKVIIPNKRVGQGYDPFAPFDKKISKVLTDWHMDAFINVLRQRYQDNPHHLRSERLCLLDHVFSHQWSHHYPKFKSDEGDINGLGRRLPGGAWNYHAGILPSFCPSMKVSGLDVDDIYAPVNFRNEHWILIWISIPKRHIVYIECHALGMSFPPALCNKNSKAIREKMALDIFKETPEGHAKENEDNDENLATYDQQGSG